MIGVVYHTCGFLCWWGNRLCDRAVRDTCSPPVRHDHRSSRIEALPGANPRPGPQAAASIRHILQHMQVHEDSGYLDKALSARELCEEPLSVLVSQNFQRRVLESTQLIAVTLNFSALSVGFRRYTRALGQDNACCRWRRLCGIHRALHSHRGDHGR